MEHQHQAGRFVSWLWAHAHHALLALTIASIALLLQQASQFARFDVASRGVMSYWQAQGDESSRREMRSRGYRPVWDPTVAGDRPLVMIVPRFLAQADDARLHPIDFAAELIRAALRQEPRILAINIDILDPYFDDERANDPQCDYLIEAAYQKTAAQVEDGPCDRPQGSIQSAAEYIRNFHIQPRARLIRVLSEGSPKTTIVVKTSRLPLSSSEFERIIFSQDSFWKRIWTRRFSWAFDLCRITDVRVALDVPQQFRGMAFEREIPTLGNVVWQATQANDRRGDLVPARHANSYPDGCAALDSNVRIQQAAIGNPQNFLDSMRGLVRKIEVLTEPPQFASVGTISSKYHETLAHGIELNVQQLSKGQPIGSMVPPGLHDKVVFLGDDFIQTHLLSFDRAAEVDFHAAVYYSNLHKAKTLTHALAFAGEVALGWLLGGLFATSWKVYGRSRLKMDGLAARSIWDLPKKLLLYVRARGILLVYIILIVTLICFIFVLANWALRSFDIWINPLPVVLGVSIKGLLASRHNAPEEHPHSWWSYYNRHPDVIFQIPIIVISLVVVLFFGH